MNKQTAKYFVYLSYLMVFFVLLFSGISFTHNLSCFFDTLLIKHGYKVENIEILGCDDIVKQQVFLVIESYKDKNIISVPITEIREKLLEKESIAKITIIRKLPNTITAILDKAKPPTLLNNDGTTSQDLSKIIPVKTNRKNFFHNLLKISFKSPSKEKETYISKTLIKLHS